MCTEEKKRHVKQDTLNFFILVVGPLRGGGGGVVKKLFFYDLPEPHETQEKKKKLHAVFSAGQYRSTEKGFLSSI